MYTSNPHAIVMSPRERNFSNILSTYVLGKTEVSFSDLGRYFDEVSNYKIHF